MTNVFMQLLINGIIAGAIYALVAAGLSLIYAVNKFIHFAHGGVIALSAYFFFWLSSQLALPFYFSIMAAVLFAAFLGYLLNRVFYRPLRAKKSSAAVLLIASIAILILLESLVLLLFGADVKTIDFIETGPGLEFWGAAITPLQIIIIVVAVVLFFVLFLWLRLTKLGQAMRAVADNKDMAEIVGISAERVYSWAFIIGSAIAGCAAVLIALEQNLTPTMGTVLMIQGFAGAILGGLASIPGAIAGAFLLGLAENFGVWFMPSGYKDAIAFILLFVFLLFRPQGIWGPKNKHR